MDSPEPPTPSPNMTIEAGVHQITPGASFRVGRDLATVLVLVLLQEVEHVPNGVNAGGDDIIIRVPADRVVKSRGRHILTAGRRELTSVLTRSNCFPGFFAAIGRALAGPSRPGPGKLKTPLTITLITVTDSGLPVREALHWLSPELISEADVNTDDPSQVDTIGERPDTQVCNTVCEFEPGDWRCCLKHSPLVREEDPGIRVKMSLLATMKIGEMISALIRAAEIA